MPRIRCLYIDCVHLDNGLCTAPVIELDPDEGCHTFAQTSGDLYEDDWDDDEDEMDGWEESYDDDDDDDWDDEDDEF